MTASAFVQVRIPRELRDRIDGARPATVSREAWVRAACEQTLEAALGAPDHEAGGGSPRSAAPSPGPASPRTSAAHGSPSPSLARFASNPKSKGRQK